MQIVASNWFNTKWAYLGKSRLYGGKIITSYNKTYLLYSEYSPDIYMYKPLNQWKLLNVNINLYQLDLKQVYYVNNYIYILTKQYSTSYYSSKVIRINITTQYVECLQLSCDSYVHMTVTNNNLYLIAPNQNKFTRVKLTNFYSATYIPPVHILLDHQMPMLLNSVAVDGNLCYVLRKKCVF